MWYFSVLVGLAFAAGDASERGLKKTGRPLEASKQAAAAGQPSLRFKVLARLRDASEWFTLKPDETLYSGDRLSFELEVTEPIFVYLIYQSPGGERQLLFPTGSAPKQVEPGASTRIPSGRRSIQLDDKAGIETVFLLGSEEALSDPLVTLSNHVKPPDTKPGEPRIGGVPERPARKPKHKPKKAKRRKSKKVSIATRGMAVVEDDAVVASPDAEGVLVFPFRFNHAAE